MAHEHGRSDYGGIVQVIATLLDQEYGQVRVGFREPTRRDAGCGAT